MPRISSHPLPARTVRRRRRRASLALRRAQGGGPWGRPASVDPGPPPRWLVPLGATSLLAHVIPVLIGLLYVVALTGIDCGTGCEPTVRDPLALVTLGYSLGFTVTPAALALCWLLAIPRSWSASWSAARWFAAGVAYVPPAMIVMGVMLLFVAKP